MLFRSHLGSCGWRLRINLLLVDFPSRTSTQSSKGRYRGRGSRRPPSTINSIHPTAHFSHFSAESDPIVDASLHPGSLQPGSHNLGDSYQVLFRTHLGGRTRQRSVPRRMTSIFSGRACDRSAPLSYPLSSLTTPPSEVSGSSSYNTSPRNPKQGDE